MGLVRLSWPTACVDLGNAHRTIVVLTVTNVVRTNKNGGGYNQHQALVWSKPDVDVINPSGHHVLKITSKALYELMHRDDQNKALGPSVRVSEHVSLVVKEKKSAKHETKRIHKRAKTATEGKTQNALGAAPMLEVEDF